MEIRNPGYSTDCIFHGYNGEISERDNYFVIKTPANPNFYWGNLLLFRAAPSPGDYKSWLEAHNSELGPGQKFVTFGWDEDTPGATDQFIEQGFTVETAAVLRLDQPAAVGESADDLSMRRIESDGDWQQVIDLQIRSSRNAVDEAGSREFKLRQFHNYRQMAWGLVGCV